MNDFSPLRIGREWKHEVCSQAEWREYAYQCYLQIFGIWNCDELAFLVFATSFTCGRHTTLSVDVLAWLPLFWGSLSKVDVLFMQQLLSALWVLLLTRWLISFSWMVGICLNFFQTWKLIGYVDGALHLFWIGPKLLALSFGYSNSHSFPSCI